MRWDSWGGSLGSWVRGAAAGGRHGAPALVPPGQPAGRSRPLCSGDRQTPPGQPPSLACFKHKAPLFRATGWLLPTSFSKVFPGKRWTETGTLGKEGEEPVKSLTVWCFLWTYRSLVPLQLLALIPAPPLPPACIACGHFRASSQPAPAPPSCPPRVPQLSLRKSATSSGEHRSF